MIYLRVIKNGNASKVLRQLGYQCFNMSWDKNREEFAVPIIDLPGIEELCGSKAKKEKWMSSYYQL